MGLLSTIQKDELGGVDRTGGPFVWGLKIDLPDRTWRFSANGYNSISEPGRYDALVSNWGDLVEASSDRGGSLPASELRAQVTDFDGSIASYLKGPNRNDVPGSSTVVRLMSRKSTPANWRTLHTGIISAQPVWPSPRVVEFILRTDDRQLSNLTPRPYWRITPDRWPKALPNLLSTFTPFIYGRHSSAGWTGKGFVPGLLVDTDAHLYMFSGGRMRQFENVFIMSSTGAPITLTPVTDYNVLPIINSLRGGLLFSLVQLNASAFVAAFGGGWTPDQAKSAVVTADVQGLEDVGDGSGVLIDNPMTMMTHWLTNFVFGEWRSLQQPGPWLPTSSRLDAPTISAMTSYCAQRNYPAAKRFDKQEKAVDVLTAWLQDWRLKAWWTPLGTLAFGVFNFTRQDVYSSNSPSRHDGDLVISPDSSLQMIESMTMRYVLDSTNGSYTSSVEAREPQTNTGATDSRDMILGPSE